jgi:hypothetical protein
MEIVLTRPSENDSDPTDYEDVPSPQVCSGNGGVALQVDQSVTVNADNSGFGFSTLDGGGSSTLVDSYQFGPPAPNNPATPSTPNNNKQPDSRTLPSCLSLGIQTVGDDLNPFSPSPFTLFDVAASGATAASAMKFNQALAHSITRGLTYPNKSSIYRGLMSASETFASVAEVLPIFALDAAVIHGIYTELTAQCSYP